MTREEVISGLQMTMDLIQFDPVTGNVRPIYELNNLDKTTYLACKEAIEALKAQNGTDTNVGSNDLISRQAAIDVIFSEPLYESGMKKRDADAVVPAIYEKIKSLPSAQPKPCEDAVSRQTLQKELALYPIDDITSEDEAGYNRAINDVQKMVLHLPSVQSEPPEPEERTAESAQNIPNDELISRKAAIDALDCINGTEEVLRSLPSAQPGQDIMGWLLAYHTKSFELHGRYMPHEVIGWLVHDFANAYMAERREE